MDEWSWRCWPLQIDKSRTWKHPRCFYPNHAALLSRATRLYKVSGMHDCMSYRLVFDMELEPRKLLMYEFSKFLYTPKTIASLQFHSNSCHWNGCSQFIELRPKQWLDKEFNPQSGMRPLWGQKKIFSLDLSRSRIFLGFFFKFG